MTNKEQTVRYHKCEVLEAESKLREAKMNLDRGYEKAKAEFEKEYARLKFEVERANIGVDQAKSWLELAEAELARGYDKN